MRKNYIAHLQEYDARTNSSKQDKYRNKFIRTVYHDQDKENSHPNILHETHQAHPTLPSKKGKQTDNKTRSHPTERDEGDHHKGERDNPRPSLGSKMTPSLRDSYSEMKLQCVKL